MRKKTSTNVQFYFEFQIVVHFLNINVKFSNRIHKLDKSVSIIVLRLKVNRKIPLISPTLPPPHSSPPLSTQFQFWAHSKSKAKSHQITKTYRAKAKSFDFQIKQAKKFFLYPYLRKRKKNVTSFCIYLFICEFRFNAIGTNRWVVSFR